MVYDKDTSNLISACDAGMGLLIIDMQHDFVAQDSALCVSGAASSIPSIRALLDAFRLCNCPVFHVIRAHSPDGSDAEVYRRHLFQAGQGLCVAGSVGAAIVPDLLPLAGEDVVIKTRFSGFYRTDLEERLRSAHVDTVVIAGTQYPNCIRGTAVDALARDFRVVVVTDACSAQTHDVAAANIRDMQAMSISCVPLAEFLPMLTGVLE